VYVSCLELGIPWRDYGKSWLYRWGLGPRNPLVDCGKAWGILGWFCRKYHIHAWNMEQGWLAERKIWFNLIYGRVVCGSPWPSWTFNMLVISIFLLYIVCKCACYCVILMDVLSFLFYWLYAGYKNGLWQTWVMDLIMFCLVNEILMNAWPNIWYFSYYERESDLLENYLISMKSPYSHVFIWPVDYMYMMCLMKFISWLGLVM